MKLEGSKELILISIDYLTPMRVTVIPVAVACVVFDSRSRSHQRMNQRGGKTRFLHSRWNDMGLKDTGNE
jgi:hypothetical protein